LSLVAYWIFNCGDGFNDQWQVRFVALKVQHNAPQVHIFDLAGLPVAQFDPTAAQGATYTFTWRGLDTSGHLIPPGSYLYRVDLGAETGEDTMMGSIAVAY